ncbi:HNH endonuclease [Agromyces atrinae]|uniref:HNH endonuclease signature motif containing protein n=1 Tax=Agromyces atrinae TaxID=592376 RepID=UPI001F582202|nr:HNH endonuclease signature motif containing protein [Agromyces atrinae]MCI2957322.1 HNH endonuclease [Agromyces atrinae]
MTPRHTPTGPGADGVPERSSAAGPRPRSDAELPPQLPGAGPSRERWALPVLLEVDIDMACDEDGFDPPLTAAERAVADQLIAEWRADEDVADDVTRGAGSSFSASPSPVSVGASATATTSTSATVPASAAAATATAATGAAAAAAAAAAVEGLPHGVGWSPRASLEFDLRTLRQLEAEENRIAADRARILARMAATTDAIETDEPTRGTSRDIEMARRSLIAEIACALTVSERLIQLRLDDAERFHTDTPTLLGHVTAGRLGFRQAQILLDHTSSLPDEHRASFIDAVLPLAESSTPPQLQRRARTLRERLHPDSITTRHQTAVAKRRVGLTHTHDGMSWLNAYLPAATALTIDTHLSDIAGHLATADEETRTLTQLRTDVFIDLLTDQARPALTIDATVDADATATGAGAGSPKPTAGDVGDVSGSTARDSGGTRSAQRSPRRRRGPRPTVMITVPALTLLGHTDEPATLDGYGPVPIETARELAGDASSFIRILTHPETGTTLSVGRDRYTVPPDLKAALHHRDTTCRFPGCNQPALTSDIDHTTDWQHGGLTTLDNLAHLCRKHHTLKHHTGWTVTHTGQSDDNPPHSTSTSTSDDPLQSTSTSTSDGTLTWTSPLGHTYTTHPTNAIPMRPRPTGAPPDAPQDTTPAPPAPPAGTATPAPPLATSGAPTTDTDPAEDPPF